MARALSQVTFQHFANYQTIGNVYVARDQGDAPCWTSFLPLEESRNLCLSDRIDFEAIFMNASSDSKSSPKLTGLLITPLAEGRIIKLVVANAFRTANFWNLIPLIWKVFWLRVTLYNWPLLRSLIKNSFVSSQAKSFARIWSFLLNASVSAFINCWLCSNYDLPYLSVGSDPHILKVRKSTSRHSYDNRNSSK